jgi:catechol 2,3-dioxygenase-like lactoylglutathione lyase family enzyme
MNSSAPNLQATNAFYYYADVMRAWSFYRDILGFKTVADYGFAKILRVAQSTYLTLVDAEFGKHSADEPKSVTLAMVTDQVAEWYEHLRESGARIHKSYTVREGSNHDGFVALDPEGYFLEFERFNPHPENNMILPLLASIDPLFPEEGARPRGLGVRATVMWLYYRDLASAQRFYEDLLGVELIVDQGWAKVYQVAGSGFLGLVDGEKGLHKSSQQKGMMVSFFTGEVDAWFERAPGSTGFELQTPKPVEEDGRVRLFVGTDPEGYSLEWDTFLRVSENEVLLQILEGE